MKYVKRHYRPYPGGERKTLIEDNPFFEALNGWTPYGTLSGESPFLKAMDQVMDGEIGSKGNRNEKKDHKTSEGRPQSHPERD